MGEISASSGAWRKGGWAITLEEHRRRGDTPTAPEPGRGTRSTETPVIVTDWRERAKCRLDKTPTSYFFPAEGDQTSRLRIPAYCARCPVVAECGQWAIAEGIPWGWFGGLSPSQRFHRAIETTRPRWNPRAHGFQRYRFGPWGKNPDNGCRCDVCTEAARDRWAKEQGRTRPVKA